MASFYAYDLPDELVANLEVYNFSGEVGSHVTSSPEHDLTPSSNPPSQASITIENGKFNCSSCGTITAELPSDARDHYRKDFHKLNIKRKIENLPPLTEDEFEKQIGELNDSLSGSDEYSSSDDDELEKVEKLLKGSHVSSNDEYGDDASSQNKPGSPFAFFTLRETISEDVVDGKHKPKLTHESVLAVYKTLLDSSLEDNSYQALSNLKNSNSAHSIIMMIGGGHFAAAVISHQKSKKRGLPPNSLLGIEVISQKSFHRYTTRRKQGGSQSASDNARGKAKSAGSSLRRYNEQALEQEIHELLDSWKSYIDSSENIYVRASGRSNRGILMNYPKAPISSTDKRIKSLPFTTGRATVTEVKRSWLELTTIKLFDKSKLVDKNASKKKVVTKEDIRRQLEKSRATPSPRSSSPAPVIALTPEEKHTVELVSLIKKSRSPRLAAYLKSNNITSDFKLQPSSQYSLYPTLLHYAASQGSHHIVSTLLTSLSADPTVKNKLGRTAYEVAHHNNDRVTTDAFQLARSALGEDKWDWARAKVGPALTKSDISARNDQEKAAAEQKVREDLAKIESREADKKLERTVLRHGAGIKLSSNVATSLGQEASLRGLSDEARMKLERERRARAAEARFKK
ncbi:Vms1p [Sugiyamaella lignohabitans]|uniref:Vms1p n=1 Tax=Sugiyamaella lignohabitans TaxID=796027 RepID=A0A167FD65_9ASCO|nr:Vms1p [Sugiyamaella lignohabitans]ANB15145.1 Vms1p [Sugiyamaella lignohabitans]